jgi:hypothetical protein
MSNNNRRLPLDRFIEQDIQRVLDDLFLIGKDKLTSVQRRTLNHAYDVLAALVRHDPTRAERVGKLLYNLDLNDVPID